MGWTKYPHPKQQKALSTMVWARTQQAAKNKVKKTYNCGGTMRRFKVDHILTARFPRRKGNLKAHTVYLRRD